MQDKPTTDLTFADESARSDIAGRVTLQDGVAQTPLVRFLVNLLHGLQQVVQQIEPMELEPLQPTTIADTRVKLCRPIAQWSIGT